MTTDEDGRSIGVGELRVISTERIPLDDTLFEASGTARCSGSCRPGVRWPLQAGESARDMPVGTMEAIKKDLGLKGRT